MRLVGLIGIGIVLLLAGPFVLALSAQESVTLAWDANSESDLAGYRIYYGQSSQSRTNRIEVVNGTTATISNLSRGRTYSFVATAYNSSGLESEPSNEVSYTVADEPQPLLIMTDTLMARTNGEVQFSVSDQSVTSSCSRRPPISWTGVQLRRIPSPTRRSQWWPTRGRPVRRTSFDSLIRERS